MHSFRAILSDKFLHSHRIQSLKEHWILLDSENVEINIIIKLHIA